MSVSTSAAAPINIQHRRTPTVARSVSSQYGTSWTDSFDFASRSPLTSALHFGGSSPMSMSMSVSCSPGSARYGADYNFERDYCSNFSCCGLTLPDMHALVAHFEDTHVVLADAYGLPVRGPLSARLRPHKHYDPASPMASADGTSPHSSVGPETPPAIAAHVHACGFPRMGAAPSPISPSSPFSMYSPPTPSEEEDVLMHFDPLDDVDLAARAGARDSTPPSPLARPVPGSVLRGAACADAGAAPVGLPPALFSAPSSSSASSPSSGYSSPAGSRAGTPSPAARASGSGEKRRKDGGAVRRERAATKKGPLAALLGTRVREGTVSVSVMGAGLLNEEVDGDSERGASARNGGSGSGKRQREKAYRCTKPGCTKSYLNPNGLKYHNAKGTCTFAVPSHSSSSPSSPSSPAAPTSAPAFSALPTTSASSSASPLSPSASSPSNVVPLLAYAPVQGMEGVQC